MEHPVAEEEPDRNAELIEPTEIAFANKTRDGLVSERRSVDRNSASPAEGNCLGFGGE
jgi:hypothetical protein